MKQETQTQPSLQVLRDGRPDYDFMPEPPTIAQVVLSGASNVIGQLAHKSALEVRMIAHDAIHNTNYRHIRHELVRKQKEERYLASIGLSRIDK